MQGWRTISNGPTSCGANDHMPSQHCSCTIKLRIDRSQTVQSDKRSTFCYCMQGRRTSGNGPRFHGPQLLHFHSLCHSQLLLCGGGQPHQERRCRHHHSRRLRSTHHPCWPGRLCSLQVSPCTASSMPNMSIQIPGGSEASIIVVGLPAM